MSLDSSLGLEGPPRKKMRKGTKSCIECMSFVDISVHANSQGRRRKIRCTYDMDRPETCNECRLRGSTCVAQAHGSIDASTSNGTHQAVDLRGRVSQLEGIVKDLLQGMDAGSITRPPSLTPEGKWKG